MTACPLSNARLCSRFWRLAKSSDCALSCCAEALATTTGDIHIAATDSLILPSVNDRGPCNDEFTHRGADIVNLKLRCDHAWTQDTSTGIGERIVRGIANNSPVNEAMLLLQISPQLNLQLNASHTEGEQLGAK